MSRRFDADIAAATASAELVVANPTLSTGAVTYLQAGRSMLQHARQVGFSPMSRRRVAVVAAALQFIVAATACATDTSSPSSVASGSSSASANGAPAGVCAVNPTSAPVPAAEPYAWVPKPDTISVSVTGIPPGTITPGAPATEVDVTLCNDSPVDYPAVGVAVVFSHCSCAPDPPWQPKGTIERFEPATGEWVDLPHPFAGLGMDFLGRASAGQPMPKGKRVTLRYRVALDRSMPDGKGGISATAVNTDKTNALGDGAFSFDVVHGSGPAPCQPNQLQVTNGGEASASGHRRVELVFALAPGATVCSLTGYPTVESGAGGPTLPVTLTPSGFMGGVTVDPPPTVTVTATQSARAVVEGLGFDAHGNGCPTYTDLRIIPPGGTDPVTVPTRLDTCALEVHPVSTS